MDDGQCVICPDGATDILEDTFTSALHQDFADRAKLWSVDIGSQNFASRMDKEDPLRDCRRRFHYPKKKHFRQENDIDIWDGDDDEEEDCIYFCGQSLGLQLRSVEDELHDVLKNWATRGVGAHFHGKFPAALCDGLLKENMAHLVGADASEVAIMNGLTVNIHVLLSTFYQPTPQRHKILMLDNGFHSDLYAVQSHVRLRGYDPDESIVFLTPKPGQYTLNPKDIMSLIEEEGRNFSLIFLEGVHFYTGQLFDIRNITRAGHKQGCVVGFDLAHAVGNVKLSLHDWNIDFAMWCTYKYLNSGAGNLGAIFVHSRHTNGKDSLMPMMAGWWGISDKFSLARDFEPAEGADRFKISNPSPFLIAMISTNLEVFKEVGIKNLVEKQRLLTGYLEYLLKKIFQTADGTLEKSPVTVITPSSPNRRGSQLSLLTSVPAAQLENLLMMKGIVCDVRRPSVIRVTPIPLYNTFTEVYKFVHSLKDIFDSLSTSDEEK